MDRMGRVQHMWYYGHAPEVRHVYGEENRHGCSYQAPKYPHNEHVSGRSTVSIDRAEPTYCSSEGN